MFSCYQKDRFPFKVPSWSAKFFDSIVHDLLLAKVSAYGFDYNSLELINSYLSGRKFITKIGSSYTHNHDLFIGAPQGSV